MCGNGSIPRLEQLLTPKRIWLDSEGRHPFDGPDEPDNPPQMSLKILHCALLTIAGATEMHLWTLLNQPTTTGARSADGFHFDLPVSTGFPHQDNKKEDRLLTLRRLA